MGIRSIIRKELREKVNPTESLLKTVLRNNPIFSVPPQGKLRVINIYVDPNTGKLLVEYQDDLEQQGGMIWPSNQ